MSVDCIDRKYWLIRYAPRTTCTVLRVKYNFYFWICTRLNFDHSLKQLHELWISKVRWSSLLWSTLQEKIREPVVVVNVMVFMKFTHYRQIDLFILLRGSFLWYKWNMYLIKIISPGKHFFFGLCDLALRWWKIFESKLFGQSFCSLSG